MTSHDIVWQQLVSPTVFTMDRGLHGFRDLMMVFFPFHVCRFMDEWGPKSPFVHEAAPKLLPRQILISLSLETTELSSSLELFYRFFPPFPFHYLFIYLLSSFLHSGSRQFWPECHLHPCNTHTSLYVVTSAMRNDERNQGGGNGSGKALKMHYFMQNPRAI